VRLTALTAVCVCTAVLVAGCGGGSNGGSNTTAPEGGGTTGGGSKSGPGEGGAPKKATAPNAPAGSKVVVCEAGAAGLEAMHAAGVDCGLARRVVGQWSRNRDCALGAGDSRGSCSLRGFRCQATRTDRGTAVSCARPGGDVSFIKKGDG
jgi:hypothetical protein